MRRVLLFITVLLLLVQSVRVSAVVEAQSESVNRNAAKSINNQSESVKRSRKNVRRAGVSRGVRSEIAGSKGEDLNSTTPLPTDQLGGQPIRLTMPKLKKLANKKLKPIQPKTHKLSATIEVGSRSRRELIEARRAAQVGPKVVDAALPAIPKGTPGAQVTLTSDFQAQSSSGGSIIALRDANNDGIADQQTIVANNAVSSGDAITKMVASQLYFGRYFAITENSELIQIDDVDGDYVSDGVTAYGDIISNTGLGIGIATAVLDDGSEAVYLMTIEPGNDGQFYSADDTLNISGFFDRDFDQNGDLDSISDFLSTTRGFTSLGGFTVGVETALIFNLGQYDNSGRIISGAIYSYYDFDGDGIPDDFADNQNDGIFADSTNSDLRPAVATDIVAAGTDYYVAAPLVALQIGNNDDIAVYSDFNASQIADDDPFIFASLPSINGFSSDLGGLAISFDGTRVAAARNQTSNGNVQSSRLLLMRDDNHDQTTDRAASQLFDNSINGLGGVCFGNADLLGEQPVIVFPRLKPIGKLALDAIGAHIDTGAILIVDNREQFAMKLNAPGTKWIVAATTRSAPGGLTIRQALSTGNHVLVIKNPTGQQSLPVAVNVQ